MFEILTTHALIASLLATPALAPTAPTDPLIIDMVSAVGSGCGQVTVTVTPDNSAIALTYDRMQASVGGGAPATASRTNCQVALVAQMPYGFVYQVISVEQHGQASLAGGATAHVAHSFYEANPAPLVGHDPVGPLSGEWGTVDDFDLTLPVVPPCRDQTQLIINREMRVYAGTSDPTATSSVSMTTGEDLPSSVYRLQWVPCDPYQ